VAERFFFAFISLLFTTGEWSLPLDALAGDKMESFLNMCEHIIPEQEFGNGYALKKV
jgi:hypothetical protein